MSTLQCPTCAAPLEADTFGGATCPYCGTQRHVRARETVGAEEIPAPRDMPEPPPADLPPDRWRFEQWIGALLRATDDRRRVAIAQEMPAFGEEHLVWAPVLADLMIGAGKSLDLALGQALGRLAGSWGYASVRGQVLRVVRARLDRLEHSKGVIRALEGVGVGGLKTLLELADRAEQHGDGKVVAEILRPVWAVVDRQTDEVAVACMEILLTLLPDAGPATRRFLIHYLADCVDSQYEVPLPGPREYHDFRFLIPLLVRFLDEQITRNPDLVSDLSKEIVRLHTFHSKSLRDADDWHRAVPVARTDAGRRAVRTLVRRLYPEDSPFAREEWPAERLAGEGVQGEVVAEVIDGRARCPACGSPLPIRGTETVVACASCSRPVRLPHGVRTGLAGRSFQDDVEHWSEAELVAALRAERDVERRRAIASELDSPRMHGSRFVPLAADLVDAMIAEPDDRVVINLEGALERLVATGGDAFRDALLRAVRVRPDARSQPRLLRCLVPYGRSAFSLLTDYARLAYEESDASLAALAQGAAASEAASEALRVSGHDEALMDRLMAQVLAMPASYTEAGAWRAGETAAQSIAQVFCRNDDDPTDEAVRRSRRGVVLHALDDRIDPSRTRYSGLAPQPGCALFSELGGPPGLGRLSAFIETLWESPADVDDLHKRLGWVAEMSTDEVRLIILCSIKEPPPFLTPADTKAALHVLTPLADRQPLAPAAAAVRGVLRGGSGPITPASPHGSGPGPAEALPWWMRCLNRTRRWLDGRRT